MKKTLIAMLLCGSLAWAQEKSTEQLMADLKAMDPAVRASAVMDLGLRGGEKVVPLLLERLSKDPADSVRAATITSFELMAIGLRREATLKQIAQGLDGALEGPARMGALRLLLTSFSKYSSQPRAKLMSALLDALKSDDEDLRAAAIDTILRDFRYHPGLAEAVLAAWKARPTDNGLLTASLEMSSVHRNVREALQAKMLERLVSQDVDLATSATGYFSTANNAWKVRQELSSKLNSPNLVLRLQSTLAFAEIFGDHLPLVEATKVALASTDSEPKGVAARVLLSRPDVAQALPGALEKLSRDKELGTAVLAELLAANQLPANRLAEVRKLLAGPEGVTLASLLPRWSEGRKLAPELEKMANRAGDNEALGLCRALLELGELPTALPRLKKLARSKNTDVAEAAMRTLVEFPQVGSRELLELAKTNKVNLGQTLMQRPGLTWDEWRAYLGVLVVSAADGPETVAGALYGKEMWPGAKGLLEKAYAREKRLENRLSLAERLLRNYGDRRVVGLACQALSDDSVRSSALSTLESACDQLTSKEKEAVGAALDRVAAQLSGNEAISAGSIYWKLDHHGQRAVPQLFAGLSEDYRLLESLPVEETARLMEPAHVLVLGDYLESLATAEIVDKDRLHTLCEVVVAAYPKTTSLVPLLTRLSESKNVLVSECIGGALEQIRK
jgi:HEAT repeat protein